MTCWLHSYRRTEARASADERSWSRAKDGRCCTIHRQRTNSVAAFAGAGAAAFPLYPLWEEGRKEGRKEKRKRGREWTRRYGSEEIKCF